MSRYYDEPRDLSDECQHDLLFEDRYEAVGIIFRLHEELREFRKKESSTHKAHMQCVEQRDEKIMQVFEQAKEIDRLKVFEERYNYLRKHNYLLPDETHLDDLIDAEKAAIREEWKKNLP